jgi:hypothetical protein
METDEFGDASKHSSGPTSLSSQRSKPIVIDLSSPVKEGVSLCPGTNSNSGISNDRLSSSLPLPQTGVTPAMAPLTQSTNSLPPGGLSLGNSNNAARMSQQSTNPLLTGVLPLQPPTLRGYYVPPSHGVSGYYVPPLPRLAQAPSPRLQTGAPTLGQTLPGPAYPQNSNPQNLTRTNQVSAQNLQVRLSHPNLPNAVSSIIGNDPAMRAAIAAQMAALTPAQRQVMLATGVLKLPAVPGLGEHGEELKKIADEDVQGKLRYLSCLL